MDFPTMNFIFFITNSKLESKTQLPNFVIGEHQNHLQWNNFSTLFKEMYLLGTLKHKKHLISESELKEISKQKN